MNKEDLEALVLSGMYGEISDPNEKLPCTEIIYNSNKMHICPYCFVIHETNIEGKCPECKGKYEQEFIHNAT